MVRHIVCWKIGESFDKEKAAAEIRDKLEALVGVVPGLVSAQVRRTYAGDFDLVLVTDFTDRAAEAAYQKHPAHLEAKKTVHRYAAGRISCDFDL